MAGTHEPAARARESHAVVEAYRNRACLGTSWRSCSTGCDGRRASGAYRQNLCRHRWSYAVVSGAWTGLDRALPSHVRPTMISQ
jgi:hypothetical protein